MEKWSEAYFVPGGFVEIKKGDDKGTWKIIEVRKYFDGENNSFRLLIDKDTSNPGDEKVLEWLPDDPYTAYLFDTFSEFTKASADSWPPPDEIELGEGESAVLFETTDASGFITSEVPLDQSVDVSSNEITHYEYTDEDEKSFLQIYDVDDMITMYIGYAMHTAFLNLI